MRSKSESTREVRWMLFHRDELVEIREGLERIHVAHENTVEGDMVIAEIRAEEKRRKGLTKGD